MPYDVAKASGRWKYHSHSDNYQRIMEKLGYPAEMFEKLMQMEFQVKSWLEGNVMKSKVDYEGKTMENSFTLGTEIEETDPTGMKRKVTYTMEGDHFVSVYPDYDGKGLRVRTSSHFVDDNTIHRDVKAGDLEGWTQSRRCAPRL